NLSRRKQCSLTHRVNQRRRITRRDEPPITASLNKLERRTHTIRRNHRQPRRQSFRNHEPPAVIPRRHTQHIRTRIRLRQLIPIPKPHKLNSLTHRPQRLLNRLAQLSIPNHLQPHVGKLPRDLNKSGRQQIHTFPMNQRSRKQKRSLYLLSTSGARESLQIREVRQVEVRPARTKLSPVLINRKLP